MRRDEIFHDVQRRFICENLVLDLCDENLQAFLVYDSTFAGIHMADKGVSFTGGIGANMNGTMVVFAASFMSGLFFIFALLYILLQCILFDFNDFLGALLDFLHEIKFWGSRKDNSCKYMME